MTLAELKTILDTTELPVAYLAFPADDTPTMPFITFQETGSNNIGADNKVWFSGMRIQINLFTRLKDRTTEELLEGKLTDSDIYWERLPEFDEDEGCYRVIYDIVI